MELCNNGSLRSWMNAADRPFKEELIAPIMKQVKKFKFVEFKFQFNSNFFILFI